VTVVRRGPPEMPALFTRYPNGVTLGELLSEASDRREVGQINDLRFNTRPGSTSRSDGSLFVGPGPATPPRRGHVSAS